MTGVAAPLLEVRDLHVGFRSFDRVIPAIRGVEFTLARGETLGIVGESGSGKSVTARSIVGLLPPTAVVSSGSIRFDDVELVGLAERRMREVRGRRIAMVYQDPMRALNPSMQIGKQLVEGARADGAMSKRAARQRAIELLDAVQIPAAAQRVGMYPHQLSGGMRQRVVIAMALANDPQLLIADEPTTALDVTVQAQILDLLATIQRERSMAMILVTHDLGVAAWHTDEIAVMYAGTIVERAPTDHLFASMRMPYTRALFDSIPRLDMPTHAALPAISGRPPQRLDGVAGCPFHPRCAHARDDCSMQAPPVTEQGDHTWSCWYPLDGADLASSASSATSWSRP